MLKNTTTSELFRELESHVPPIISSDQGIFVVQPYETTVLHPPTLRFIRDNYRHEFYPEENCSFIGVKVKGGETNALLSLSSTCANTSDDVNLDCIVVVILKLPSNLDGEHCAIKITKKDHNVFTIKSNDAEKTGTLFTRKKMEKEFENHLNETLTPYIFYHAAYPEISDSILKIEEKHPQNNKAFKVALLYSNGSESTLQDYFSHNLASSSPSFWKFLDLLATRISLNGWQKYRGDFGVHINQDSYYTVWKEMEIMFHVGLMMNSEQHRRLIGNDVVFIIFHDCFFPLDPKPLDSLGTVPQVFCVVQPLLSDENHYRIDSFARPNIRPFKPFLPRSTAFHKSVLKDHLLSKVYNGYCEALSRPPMNRLFEVPRSATINDLFYKYPPKNLGWKNWKKK
eukprot:TRINITY_DN6827_c0_g4_i2.p1 TRINITY_DN6827_c0_g4~~TRINITY_DN6827_c0_g4_i2.p1  ORF type:complete len:398 (-),score=81.96 TRINITY_DN6827_c0_g4_i2:160-1353(-)